VLNWQRGKDVESWLRIFRLEKINSMAVIIFQLVANFGVGTGLVFFQSFD